MREYLHQTKHLQVAFSPHLGEVARASLARVTELCRVAFLAEASILFYSHSVVAGGLGEMSRAMRAMPGIARTAF